MTYTPAGQAPDTSIPDAIVGLAAWYSLGPFIKAYWAQERTRAMLVGCPILILGPPFLCVGLVALLSFSYGIAAQMGLTGDDNAPQLIAVGIAFIALAVFAVKAVPAAWTINASGTVVYLYQNGMIHTKGARTTPLPWQHIATARLLRAYRYNPTKLVIKTLDRRTITLHSIKDLRELAGRVQQALAPMPLL